MERFYERQRCQLYPHYTLFRCAILELQFLQKGKLAMPADSSAIRTMLMGTRNRLQEFSKVTL